MVQPRVERKLVSVVVADVVGLTDDVGCRGQSGLTADIAETMRLTRSGTRGRAAVLWTAYGRNFTMQCLR